MRVMRTTLLFTILILCFVVILAPPGHAAAPQDMSEEVCTADLTLYVNPPKVTKPKTVTAEAYRLGANPVFSALNTSECRAELARQGFVVKKAGKGEVCGPMMDGRKRWYEGSCLEEGAEYFYHPDRPAIAAALGCGNVIVRSIPPLTPAQAPPNLAITIPPEMKPAPPEPPPAKNDQPIAPRRRSWCGRHKATCIGGPTVAVVVGIVVGLAGHDHGCNPTTQKCRGGAGLGGNQLN